MFKRLLKRKFGAFIALCTLIVMAGIFMMESDKVFASENYMYINNVEYTNNVNRDLIINNGSLVFGNNDSGENYYFLAIGDKDVKVAIGYYNSKIRYIFGISEETYSELTSDENVIAYCRSGSNAFWTSKRRNFTRKVNDLYICYYELEYWDGSYSINSIRNDNDLTIFTNETSLINSINDGSWEGPLPPNDPEYSYNAELGSLQNVYFRQVYDTVNNESIIDITYDQYTSTGIDLSQNGYGIATQVIKKDLSSQKVQISNTIERAWDNTKKTILKIVTNYINEWGINLNMPGGGGHSFSFDDEEPANALTKYDIILRPYYYDGFDYTYGDATIIEDVDINKIGTRMMKNADTTVNDDPVDINYTKVKITNYDFTWNSSNISYNEYMNYNIMNEETVYNYTLYSDDSTEINNIGYSTTNIYNYDGDNPSFTFNDFNITQLDVINTVKSFKDVWSAIIYFVPHVLGLFAYLPTWSLVLVSGCFIILAGVCVVKFVAPLL